ncbi:hypothetical protein ROHU_009210 [Labeo rohita]|uniref:Uncharacterized protein n=1 Tax=Labeo rohita TaxID=84645 RepID=A0A498M9C9_LABRO|nr:hypothetical protein ROHU_009210 [Labeo rohita]
MEDPGESVGQRTKRCQWDRGTRGASGKEDPVEPVGQRTKGNQWLQAKVEPGGWRCQGGVRESKLVGQNTLVESLVQGELAELENEEDTGVSEDPLGFRKKTGGNTGMERLDEVCEKALDHPTVLNKHTRFESAIIAHVTTEIFINGKR